MVFAHIRGETVAVIDLGLAIGMAPIPEEDLAGSFIIITEYNRRTQGFLVAGVDRIANLNWENVSPPPKGAGRDIYLTAVAHTEEQMVAIIDVEKILAEVSPGIEEVGAELVSRSEESDHSGTKPVLIVDDSSVARRQVERCISAIGMEVVTCNDGKQALAYLDDLVADGSDISDHLGLMISDVEMPEMDGYTLVARCKEHRQLASLHIILHTSLSGVFNKAMVKKVGADAFMAKFSPDELAEHVMEVQGLCKTE